MLVDDVLADFLSATPLICPASDNGTVAAVTRAAGFARHPGRWR